MPEHQFADPENKKYPIDTPEHVRAAASYAAKEHNAGRLSKAKFDEIMARVHAAEKRHGIGEGAKDSGWELVERLDLASGSISEHRRTEIGGLVARGNFARTGVLRYRDPSIDGGYRRELVTPEELFDPDSLDSLAHATLTDDHPSGPVTSDSWRNDSIGHIAGRPKRNGKFASGELHIQHRPAADKADRGDLVELSCGYKCHYDPTPGVTADGEHYDGIQRRRRYNHVAVGPVGWGRAGSEVRMRLDALGAVSDGQDEPYVRDGSHEKASENPPMAMTPEEKAAYDKALADAKADRERADAAETARKDEKARADKAVADKAIADGEVATMRKQVDRETNDAARDASRKARDAEIAEAVQLRDDAKVIFRGDSAWKADRKTNEQIMTEAIAKMDPEVKLDELLAPIRGLKLDAAATSAAEGTLLRSQYRAVHGHWRKVAEANGQLERVVTDANKEEQPGDDDEAEDARAAMVARNRDRFKSGRDRKRDRKRDAAMPAGKENC